MPKPPLLSFSIKFSNAQLFVDCPSCAKYCAQAQPPLKGVAIPIPMGGTSSQASELTHTVSHPTKEGNAHHRECSEENHSFYLKAWVGWLVKGSFIKKTLEPGFEEIMICHRGKGPVSSARRR